MNSDRIFESFFLFDSVNIGEIDRNYSLFDSLCTASYTDGEKIVCDGLPLISSGNAAIVSGEGDHVTVLRRLSQGDTFGAATVFCKRSHKTSVISDGDCSIIYIPRQALTKLIECEPVISLNYISFLSERIDFLNRKITAFTAGTSDARLAIYLSGLPEKDGKVSIPVSLSELSNMLGVGRASLYRSFDSLSENGIIKKIGKEIRILDQTKLNNFTK